MAKNNFSLRKKLVQMLGGVVKNAMSIPDQFRRIGNRNPMYPNWSDAQMSDEDHYKGYGYGAITRRAVMVATVAKDYVKTDTDKKDEVHPYLTILKKSPTFTDFQFWTTISTYLDLEGWFPLMAVRNFEKERKGNVIEFKLLNPYFVRRVVKYDSSGFHVGGYVETKGGFIREIPTEMIIDIRNLNPFADNVPMGITDAVKDSQFSLRSASDYTRQTLRNNINAPGILSTDIKLEKEEFENFMARVREHKKGEPIFGNGNGALSWQNMESDLTKAALKDINEVNRDEVLSTYGVSKTIMGIEQSGVTRDTADVQQDLLIELQVLPQLQLIVDALNQDFRNNAPQKTKGDNIPDIIVDNPLGTDHDDELKDLEVKTEQFNLYKTLVDRGVDTKTAAAYVKGEIGIEGVPIEKFELPDLPTNPQADNWLIKNDDQSGLVQQQQGALKNAIVRIDQHLLIDALARLPKKIANSIDLREKDVITQAEQTDAERDLALVLTGFYAIVVNLQGQSVMRKNAGKFSLPGQFSFTKEVEAVIKKYASQAAESHIKTVANDIYETAAKAAKEGKSLKEIEGLLKQKYNTVITETRAKAISRTETNRAFTTAQHEADKQFVSQNELGGKAYKKWVTRSDSPCPICEQLASEPPILLSKNFRNLGDKVKFGKGDSYTVEYVSLESGNAHPNCSCTYELIIES